MKREVALRHRGDSRPCAKKIAAVMPAGQRHQLAAVRKPAATVRIGVSITPAMNVKPNSAAHAPRAVAQRGDDEQRADHHAEHQRAAP